MGSSAATGPIAMICSVSRAFFVFGCPLSSRTGLPSGSVTGSSYSTGCTTATCAYGAKFMGTPCHTSTGARHHREGQQHPERRAGHVHPEIAEQGRALPGQAPDERDARGEAGGSGQEILGREAEDLAQIAHRGLAAVRLPGRRGREADRRVHREVGSERPRPVRRVERVEQRLHPQHRVQQQRPAEAESDEAPGIVLPVHLGGGVDPGEPVDGPLQRTHHRVEPGPLAAEDPGEIAADRPDEQGDDQQECAVLGETCRAHRVRGGAAKRRWSGPSGSESAVTRIIVT